MNNQEEMNEIRAAIREQAANIAAQGVNIESLHSNLRELFESQARQDAKIAATSEQIAQLTSKLDTLVDVVTKLALVATDHQGRIKDLESGSSA